MFMCTFLIKPAIVASAILVTAVSFSGTAKAAINIANGAPVIGGSGDWDFGPFNSGLFPTHHVTNGVNANPDNNVGAIHENFNDGSYWLGQEGQPTGHFVIDLGTASRIGLIELINTRNGNARDRGTGTFEIYASNQVASGAFGMDLVSAVQIVSGALTPQTYVGGFPTLPRWSQICSRLRTRCSSDISASMR